MTSLGNKFDNDVEQILETTVRGEANRKLQAMTIIILSIAYEWSGEQEGKATKAPYTKNQRAVRIHNIRQEMRMLKSQYK